MTATASLSVQVPVLETQRLILREPRLADFDAYADFSASSRADFVGGPMDRAQAWRRFASGIGHWILRGFGLWTIEDKTTGAVAGRTGLIAHEGWPETELGWQIYDGFEGQGYAHEAAMAARHQAYHVMGLPPMISLSGCGTVAAALDREIPPNIAAWLIVSRSARSDGVASSCGSAVTAHWMAFAASICVYTLASSRT